MSFQAQVVINGTTIYHLMARPGTLAIIGTTVCMCITGTTCFNIYYWHYILCNILMALQNARVLLALHVSTYIIGTTSYVTYIIGTTSYVIQFYRNNISD